MTESAPTVEELNAASEAISEAVIEGDFEWDQLLASLVQDAISPREELKHRIQCAIDGVDPGEPLHRGSDGWKVWA